MRKGEVLSTAAFILAILGIIMVYLGGFHAPKLMLAPVVTGLGFWVISWVFYTLRK